MRIIWTQTKDEMRRVFSAPHVPEMEKELTLAVVEAQKFVWRYEAVLRELGKEKKENGK